MFNLSKPIFTAFGAPNVKPSGFALALTLTSTALIPAVVPQFAEAANRP